MLKQNRMWNAAWLGKIQNFLFTYAAAFALGYLPGKRFENRNDSSMH